MPAYIIHKDGAFNVFSSVVDACYFDSSLTEAELREWYRTEYGEAGMRELPDRIARAVATGTSCRVSTLDSHIANNRAGPNEKRLSRAKFLAQFLSNTDFNLTTNQPLTAGSDQQS